MAPRDRDKRLFSQKQKDKCWKKAPPIHGRDPNRWRYDAVGNPVLKCLRGCLGPLCHEYDHIVPFSKGGLTSSKNCQVLQTSVNRFKSDKTPTKEELWNHSIREHLSVREMDLIEFMAYGDITKY